MEHERDMEFVDYGYRRERADDARVSGHGGRGDNGDRFGSSDKFCGLRCVCVRGRRWPSHANGGVSDQRNGDHDDECEPDGCSEHEFQRDIHAGEQFERELCEVHGHGNGVHDYGDAGSGSGRISASTSEWHSDRAACSGNAGLYDIREPEHADGYRWQCDDVHGEYWSTERFHRGSDAERQWITGRGDGELFTGDGDGNRKLDVDGNDDREHTGRDIDTDDYGNKRKPDAYSNGEFGNECTTTTAGLYDFSESEHADSDCGQCDDLHGEHWSIERVWWGRDAECEWIADRGDGGLFTGDGDRSRELDVDGNDGGEHSGGDVDVDDYRNKRERDAYGDGDADSDGGREGSDQHRLCWARDSHGEYGGGWGGGEAELEQRQRADEYDAARVGG